MAEAIISVVVERIAAIIEDQIRYEVNLVSGVEKEVLDLSSKLTAIREELDDAEKKGVNDPRVRRWLQKLEDVAYEMDDILDEWNYSLLKHKRKYYQSTDPAVASAKQKVCCSVIPLSSCLCYMKCSDRRKTGKRIENAKATIYQIVKEKDDFKFVSSVPLVDPVVSKPLPVQSTSSIEPGEVQGQDIDKNRNDVVRKLMDDDGSQILSVVGMGGIGKTTLAQLVYNDTRIKDYFELEIWICVSHPFDLGGIARGIVEGVTKETIPPNTNQLELVLQKLRDCISGKKFLLVLDDVWTERYQEWKPLKINLKYGASGSKIMVTTRKEGVAKMMGTLDNDIYRPQQLTDEECWSLLRLVSHSGRSEEECGRLKDVGQKIASKCKGLPLAAIVLGSLLQLKNSLEEWENVLESDVWALEKAEIDLFPHLLLSYEELSPALKRCFSYCAIYPKDYRIHAGSLIEVWMALGYLGSVTGKVGVEVKGQEYFNSLAQRSLFQDFEKDGEFGEQIEWCKMHDIVHDFARFLRKNNERAARCRMHDVAVHGESNERAEALGKTMTSCQEYRSLFWDKSAAPVLCDCCTSLRVLRLKNSLNGTPQAMEKLIHLRWLDMSGTGLSKEDLKIICRLYFLQTLLIASCSLEEIPVTIGNLVHLRHLDVSKNRELKELPESMCGLVELHILNVGGCSDLYELPEGIQRLKSLQHLLIVYTPANRRFPRGLAELSGLRTLNSFHGGSGCNKLGLLKNLNRLTGTLRLVIHLSSINDDLAELGEGAREAGLRNKIHIQSLGIQFEKDEEGRSSSLSISSTSSLWMDVIEALEPHRNVKDLKIWGYGGSRLPHWISSPLNLLKEVRLYYMSEVLSLPPMGKLPFLELLCMKNLKELKVAGREFLGIEYSSTPNDVVVVVAFPKLKQLEFAKCDKWWEWEDITEEEEESDKVSIMPCLTKLTVDSCRGLKKLPHGLLRKASSLQMLSILYSPELQRSYEDKHGSPWRSISCNNPLLQLHLLSD